MKKKLLFITRKYPPQVGGMERYSYDFYNNIKNNIDTTLLANKKGNIFLPIFLAYAFIYIIFNGKKFTNIHFGDGLLGPIAWFAKKYTKAKITITIHALDITYNNWLYQKIIPKSVSKLDTIVCVSNYTISECVKRGVQRKKCVFIPNGIDFNNLKDTNMKLTEIEKKYGISLKGKKILLSVGRLIKRKGNEWFVSDVMPKLDNDFIYVIGGIGPEEKNIKESIEKNNLQKRVIMLGKISDDEKICLYKNSHLFIMPNIKVPGDAEGFGIAVIEAAAYGLPCIASDIEGISDAVIDGKTGWLLTKRKLTDFINTIRIANPIKNIKKSIFRKFNWKTIIKKYVRTLI